MNLCRCENGHFYDRDKYATCPHCATGLGGDDSVTEMYSEEPAAAAAPSPIPLAPMNNPDDVTEAYVEPAQTKIPLAPTGNAPSDTGSSSNSVGASGSDDDDHTVAFMEDVFAEAAGAATGDTAAAQKPTQVSSAPCVGWLVAINGPHIGQDFRLITGKNFIGRGGDMDVSLPLDKSVSRNKHAIVIYEPKKQMYLIQPGESSSLVYHNDEVVLNPVQLKAYDQITVGDVNLVFIPLCNPEFNWSELLANTKG